MSNACALKLRARTEELANDKPHTNKYKNHFDNDYARGANNCRIRISPETTDHSGDTNDKIMVEILDNY